MVEAAPPQFWIRVAVRQGSKCRLCKFYWKGKVEDAADADAKAFYTTAASIRSKPKLCNIGKF
jgi:hypothetical protein